MKTLNKIIGGLLLLAVFLVTGLWKIAIVLIAIWGLYQFLIYVFKYTAKEDDGKR